MKINKFKIILLLILIFAAALRFYKLGDVPNGITWDEAAVGYNAWTITQYGKDEWGKALPLVFKSFEDDKSPIHIYLTSVSVFIFGLNDFSIRLPMAVFGVINCLLLYYLSKLLTDKEEVGLLSAFVLAISPYNIQFSRFNHEANLALALFLCGLIYLVRFIKNETRWFFLAIALFGLSIITYHSPKVFIPLFLVFTSTFYLKGMLNMRQIIYVSGVLLFFIGIFFLEPQLLGQGRLSQTSISTKMLEDTMIFQKTDHLLLARLELYLERYISHFSFNYLFVAGDPNPKFSSQYVGQFYVIELLFLLMGLAYIFKTKEKKLILVLVWALLAPIPASITGGASEAPHAARSLFVMGSWHIIIGLGIYFLFSFIKKVKYRIVFLSILVSIYILLLLFYLKAYYTEYSSKFAFEWIYGMKQSVEFVKQHPEYEKIYITDSRSQPYIFYLYYLKYPLPDFLESKKMNDTISRSYNLVTKFDKYNFGGWDAIESEPVMGVLYVVKPADFDGLRHKEKFYLKKPIYNPDNTVAFYLVSLY